MAISDETLKRMIAEFGGFELSEEELALVRPELESYLEEVENIRSLDLSAVMSSRLLRASENPASYPPAGRGAADRIHPQMEGGDADA